MAIVNHLSIITWNINGLNSSVKGCGGYTDFEKNLLINSLQETHFKDIHGQRVKRWKKIFHVSNLKKAKLAILVSGKIHTQLKIITGDKRRPSNNDKRVN